MFHEGTHKQRVLFTDLFFASHCSWLFGVVCVREGDREIGQIKRREKNKNTYPPLEVAE